MLAGWATREWARKGEERARGIMKEIVSVEVSAFSATVGSLAVRQLNDDLLAPDDIHSRDPIWRK